MSRVVHTNIWSAYGYARKAGYEGTEEEFEQGLKKSAEAAGNAEESASTASEAATEAEAARDAAAQSAESASTSEDNALEYANSAAQVLMDAQAVAQTVNAKATEAAGSASRAESYAKTATTRASEATTAAGTATSAASSASGSAQAADASATAAAASETNAAASASSASTSAGSASESADEAAESAAAAQAVKDSIPADYSQLSADVTDLKSQFDELQSDGVVASSEQLLSDNYTVNQTPYLYRQTNSNGADRAYEEIVGGSVVWNQLCNGSSVTVASGRKYLLKKSSAWSVGISTGSAITGLTSGSDMVHDLTVMLGTIIADYIYSLEQSSAGAGVAFFRNLFPEDYYEYDAGTMRHVSGVSAKETVGKNLLKQITPTYSGLSIIKNPDGSYTVYGKPSSNGSVYFWNSANDPIVIKEESIFTSGWNPEGNATFIFSTKDSATAVQTSYADTLSIPAGEYTSFRIYVSAANTYSFTIKPMIRLASASDASFKPYIKRTYPLDSSLTLRGIPKLDSNNQLYYDGDTYASDGTVTRKYGIVDLGMLTWDVSSTNVSGRNRFISRQYINPKQSDITNGATSVCSGLMLLMSGGTFDATADGYTIAAKGDIYVYLDAYKTADPATFKSAMSGVYLVYELVTPITEQADSYINPQICDPYGTEEFVSTSIVPVGHYTKYPENLRAKIEGLPWDLSMIAPIETGTTASRAYAVGKYFLLNNKFCKAKTAIASGATFTLNTNYTVTTVADELYTALH